MGKGTIPMNGGTTSDPSEKPGKEVLSLRVLIGSDK
jgi:hypothetical protein